MADEPKRGVPGELIGLMAHDMRSPLGAMLANLHYLQSSMPDLADEVAEAVEDVVALCKTLERYVHNLDLLGRGGESLPNAHMSVRLGDVVDQAAQRMSVQVSTAGLVLELVGDGRDVVTEVNGLLFDLALDNLISNALEHAPRGSSIRLRAERRGDDAVVSVEDDGPAIPDKLRQIAVSESVSTAHKRDGRFRYGRGLGVLATHVAARVGGFRLELGGDDSGARHSLVAGLDEGAKE